MMYEGKEVWTQENFSYQDVKIGDLCGAGGR